MIRFVAIDPRVTAEMLGMIPLFLDADDPRPAKEQIDANYQHGGGWYPLQQAVAVPDTIFAFQYPGDPIYKPLAIAKLRSEVIVFYDLDFVGIWQRDGTFEVSRMD